MKPTPPERLDAAAGTRIPANVNLYPRIAAQLERETFMQTLRAKPALMILFVLLALVVLSGAAYAVGRSLGYIPGVGIVEQGTLIRVLAEPVSASRDGVTVTITEATLTADKTVLTYTIENVPWDAISHQEDVPGCYGQANIRLPNGALLVPQSGGGGMNASGFWETRLVYSAFSTDFNEAEFLLDCIPETLPGKAPENWKLSLRFAPAPPDLTIAPVVEIPVSTAAVSLTPEAFNTLQTENVPQLENIYGIRLLLDKFILLEDGYYLIGHTETDDERISKVYPADWITAVDESGRSLALEMVSFDETMQLTQELDQATWAYRLYGTAFQGEVTLRLSKVNLSLAQSIPFTLDLHSSDFSFAKTAPGTVYEPGFIPLALPGLNAQLIKATTFQLGELRGFNLAFDADPRLDGIAFEMNYAGSAMSNSYRDAQNGQLIVQVGSDPAPAMPFLLNVAELRLNGNWSVTWNPPTAPAGATPFYLPQACLGLDSVKQALANPPTLPVGLKGRLLLMRGALSPDPTLFIANLDNSAEIPLAFGQGTLSPDGSRAVYSDENNQLTLMEVASKQKTILGAGYLAPLWSPDGTKIAFQRETPKGFNIFVMNADGTNLRPLTDTTELFSLSGWSGDGQSLLIQTGARIEFLNVNDGSRSVLLETQHNPYGSPSAALSSDGQWLAYLDKVVGRMTPGLYLKALPNGEPRLLVELEHWNVFNPVFSPDGQWLAFSVVNGDTGTDAQSMLINISNCEVLPLTGMKGEIRQWDAP
jgi:hypothetical protein